MQKVHVNCLVNLEEELCPDSLSVYNSSLGHCTECPYCLGPIVKQHRNRTNCVQFTCTLLHQRGRPPTRESSYDPMVILSWRSMSDPSAVHSRAFRIVVSRRKKHNPTDKLPEYPTPSALQFPRRSSRAPFHLPPPKLVAPEPMLISPHYALINNLEPLQDLFVSELNLLLA